LRLKVFAELDKEIPGVMETLENRTQVFIREPSIPAVAED